MKNEISLFIEEFTAICEKHDVHIYIGQEKQDGYESLIPVIKVFFRSLNDEIKLGTTENQPEQRNFIDAVNAVKDGSHQIERDCDNIELLKAVLKAAFPEDDYLEIGDKIELHINRSFFFCYSKGYWYSSLYMMDLPIIKLTEIEPEVQVKWDGVTNIDLLKPEFKNGDEVDGRLLSDWRLDGIYIGKSSGYHHVVEFGKDGNTHIAYCSEVRKPQPEINTIKQKVREICTEVSEIILKDGNN